MNIKFEGEMFEPIKLFLLDQSNSSSINTFSYDSHKGVPEHIGIRTGWPLIINDYCSNPDVYGIDINSKVYLCQGKLVNKQKLRLWELIGQAISNRNYCHFLYIFCLKQDLENLKKNKDIFEDFIELLRTFKIGLLTVCKEGESIQVTEIIDAIEQSVSEENLNITRKKILEAINLEQMLKKFLKNLISNLSKAPSSIMRLFLQPGQPSFYIYYKKWQKKVGLSFLVKFYVDRVLIGINVYEELIQHGIKDMIINNESFIFTEYNGDPIDDQFKKLGYKPKSSRTHDFSNSIQLNQKFNQFLMNLDSDNNQKKLKEISTLFSEMVDKLYSKLKNFYDLKFTS